MVTERFRQMQEQQREMEAGRQGRFQDVGRFEQPRIEGRMGAADFGRQIQDAFLRADNNPQQRLLQAQLKNNQLVQQGLQNDQRLIAAAEKQQGGLR